MSDILLPTALVVAIVVIVVLAVRNASYRATHLYTEADMKKRGKESIQGSRLTRGGQVADQLAPLLPAFYEHFNPKDARFLGGGPIDFVIFDGLDENDVRQVVFLEVKTGASDLNPRQRHQLVGLDFVVDLTTTVNPERYLNSSRVLCDAGGCENPDYFPNPSNATYCEAGASFASGGECFYED